MKIKKGGTIINLTEGDIKKLAKSLLTERVSNLIQQGDTWCDIRCKRKIAAHGSNGDIIKHIQHALAKGVLEGPVGQSYGPYNPDKGGGGMSEACAKNWKSCDGKFREETKKAVKEFQDDIKELTTDGIVGLNTLNALCKYGFDLPQEACEDDCKCDRDDQTPIDDIDINIDIDENIGSKECNTILRCIRTTMAGPPGMLTQGTDKWAIFLSCIKGVIDTRGKCKGCPKYVWYGPQVEGGDKEYWARKGFEEACVRNKCSIATRNYKLFDNWQKNLPR